MRKTLYSVQIVIAILSGGKFIERSSWICSPVGIDNSNCSPRTSTVAVLDSILSIFSLLLDIVLYSVKVFWIVGSGIIWVGVTTKRELIGLSRVISIPNGVLTIPLNSHLKIG